MVRTFAHGHMSWYTQYTRMHCIIEMNVPFFVQLQYKVRLRSGNSVSKRDLEFHDETLRRKGKGRSSFNGPNGDCNCIRGRAINTMPGFRTTNVGITNKMSKDKFNYLF